MYEIPGIAYREVMFWSLLFMLGKIQRGFCTISNLVNTSYRYWRNEGKESGSIIILQTCTMLEK